MDTSLDMKNLETVVNTVSTFAVNYSFQILGAIIILILGWVSSNWIQRAILKFCKRVHLDITLSKFFAGLGKTIVLVFVIIIALGKFGITVAPFIAALGAVAFGGTLALQGPLSNYAAGITIILTRPFVVGDTIRIKGVQGVVDEIKLAYTRLSNEDGEIITIPNKQIVGEIISNTHVNLVVEQAIQIDYKIDPDIVIGVIKSILLDHPDVAQKPSPMVGIEKFGESGRIIGIRYWLPTRRYFELLYQINGEIDRQLVDKEINIAGAKLDVHINSGSA